MITKKYVNNLAYQIVGAAIEVHREIGPGLLESIYEKLLRYELVTRGYKVEKKVSVPVLYKGKSFECDLRLDLLVNDLIIVELKAVEKMIPLFEAQLLTYLKLLNKPKGLLINFNTSNITKSLVPMVTEEFSKLKES